jgi:hypothetical protein
MQTYNSRLYRLKELNIYALYRIKYSNSKIRGTNNYRLLKLVLGITLVYPYIYSYS